MLNLVSVFMTVIRLPGGQKGELGQAIHFPNNLESAIVKIPVEVEQANILILDEEARDSDKKFKYVRLDLLHKCYAWLKKNNVFFECFRIDTLPFFFARHTSSEYELRDLSDFAETGFVDCDYDTPDIDSVVNSVGIENIGNFSIPKNVAKPLTIFDRNHLEEKAFVDLFPLGKNGFDEPRRAYLTYQSYFQRRLLSDDNRFRRNPSYLFWALNLMEQDRLQQGISIALKRRHLPDGTLSSVDLERLLKSRSYSFVQKIRGSVAYWNNVLMNLLAKVAALGPPTWFLTLSADDMGFPDYKQLLRSDCGSENHFTNIVGNPVMCALQFHRRWVAIRRYLKESKVLGVISDSFERIEFQNRGSPHLHIFLWIEGAPNLNDPDLPDFIDKYVSTCRPQNEDDLQLVNKYQLHRHTDTCTKFGRSRCRFNYPRPVCTATRVVRGKYLGMKRFYETKRNEGDEYVNCYNIQILRVFRSNMDLQFVGDAYGVAVYVCSYLCKAEPTKFKVAIDKVVTAINEMKDELSARQILSRLGTAVITKRCVSAQEAAFRILSIPLCFSSRITVFINCRPKGDRYRIICNVEKDGNEESALDPQHFDT